MNLNIRAKISTFFKNLRKKFTQKTVIEKDLFGEEITRVVERFTGVRLINRAIGLFLFLFYGVVTVAVLSQGHIFFAFLFGLSTYSMLLFLKAIKILNQYRDKYGVEEQ